MNSWKSSSTGGKRGAWLLGAAICVAVTLLGRQALSGLRPLFRFVIVAAVSFAGYGAVNLPVLKTLMKSLRRR